MHGMRLAQRRRTHFRQANGANLPGPLEIRQGADAFLDRNHLVPATQVVQIDAFGLEIAQSLVADDVDGLVTRIDHAFAIASEQPALAGDDHVVGTAAENRTDELLIGAEAVQGRGIEMRDAQLERAANQTFRVFAWLRRPVAVRQVHATEADRGDVVRAELARQQRGQPPFPSKRGQAWRPDPCTEESHASRTDPFCWEMGAAPNLGNTRRMLPSKIFCLSAAVSALPSMYRLVSS